VNLNKVLLKVGALLSSLAFTACATTFLPAVTLPAADTMLSGRLTVSVAAFNETPSRTENVSFELAGNEHVGHLNLITPLGNVLAQARWTRDAVTLITPTNKKIFNSLDELTQEVLGESLPLVAFFDWLRGKPWSGADNTPLNNPLNEPGFNQLGWSVNLKRFSDAWVVAQRERAPSVTVRIKLDAPT
jgi:outer membrane lipoprotein LolB